MTITQLFEKCWSRHWDKKRYHDSGWSKEVMTLYAKHIMPALGQKECNSVTPKVVRHWHETMAETPTAANRALEVLSRMFNFAEEEEIRPLGTNPCRVVHAFPETHRERYATEEELQRIGEVLVKRAEKEPEKTALVWLLALTGARPKSLTTARREWLMTAENGDGILSFSGKSTHRTGQKESVIIPAFVMDRFIRPLPERRDGLLLGNVEYRRFWESVRREAKCEDLWLRDLRRTFASIALSEGFALDSIGRLLNQRSQQTTLRYAHLTPAAKIKAATSIAGKVSQLMGGMR